MDNTLAARFGIREGDGLQTRCWAHHLCASFRCALCGGRDEMACASITLFDGQEELGDLCNGCVTAGPQGAAGRAQRRAEDLRAQAAELDDLAEALSTLGPARWSTLAELEAEHEWALKEMRNGGLRF